VNQDGTVNSPANPAARGSTVSIFANSASFWRADMGDGLVTGDVHTEFLGAANFQIFVTNVVPRYTGNSPGTVTAVDSIACALQVSGIAADMMFGDQRSKRSNRLDTGLG
jgi:uncharacterized protein (TIGR03437 family)